MSALPQGGDSGALTRVTEHSTVPSTTTTTGRRTLMRAALWSAPVVAVALATPAAAASGGGSSKPTPTPTPSAPPVPVGSTSTLLFDTWQSNAHWDNAGHRTGIDTLIQIQNSYWTGHGKNTVIGAPVPILSVSVLYPASCRVTGAPTALTGSGWSFTTIAARGEGAVEYIFTWSGPALQPSKSTPQLSYTVAATLPRGQAQLTADASAPNADKVKAPAYGNTLY
ncbi:MULTISPECIES: hypothetical protein [unclassified Rathayibacter]|uniref:hypothetical protein n=1 Tax=unclassified Rathayibacter TaxID=2609250 RepID=UPI00188ABBA6|nr:MULTISPECIES: hypothetical protein [unclassified Rathayibacter]MBF4461368.1 hypothetical protein [Rathayibacter sp. VKM Ac-2879]MBF4502779.1 hypothetical protein [Rathayibacter sp. VKM Ac-2878]